MAETERQYRCSVWMRICDTSDIYVRAESKDDARQQAIKKAEERIHDIEIPYDDYDIEVRGVEEIKAR